MNKLPIKRKVERAFAQDFFTKHLALTGVTIYEGHKAEDSVVFPALIVYAEDSQEFSGMPAETGVRIVRLRISWMVDATVTSRSVLDEWKEQLECSVLNQEKVKEALNAPADDEDEDERVVKKIHFHATMMTGDPSGRDNTDWVEQQVFEVIVEDMG
jgi:hypothetical protein